MKRFILIGLGIAVVLVFGMAIAQEKQSQEKQDTKTETSLIADKEFMALLEKLEKPKGPMIKLEQEEVSIFDEKGKLIKKVCVSKYGEEKEAIFDHIEPKLFKKFGVRSLEEIYKKTTLEEEYRKECKKLMKVKDLEQPKLKFIDKDGKVLKEILLSPVGSEKWAIYVKKEKKKHPKLEKPHLIKEDLMRESHVSKNGKYAAIIESISQCLLPETEKEKEQMMDTCAGYLSTINTIKYFDVTGNMLWEKQLPENMEVNDIRISDNGEIITYLQAYMIGGLDESEPHVRVVVCNKAGKELFKVPEKRENRKDGEVVYILGKERLSPMMFGGLRIEALSPKGRYVSIADGGMRFLLFIDLQNKTTWKPPLRYLPYKIEDDGIAYTSYYDENEKIRKRKIIDLKEHLGK